MSIISSGGEVDGSQCIAEAMPSMDASGRTRPHLKANKRNGLMLVFNNYTFDCSGILKQWSLQIQYSGDRHCEFNFDLHILRPTDRDDYCGLVSVGSDRTTLTIGERRVRNKRYSMSVNTTNDVIIKEGDVMGLVIYMEECERQMEVKLMEEKEMKRKSASSRVVHSTRKVSSKFTPTDGLDIEGVAGFSCGRDSNNDGDSESSSESSRRSTKSSRGRSSTTSSASRQRSSSTPINSNIRRRDRRRRQQDNPAPFKLHAGAPLINAIIGIYDDNNRRLLPRAGGIRLRRTCAVSKLGIITSTHFPIIIIEPNVLASEQVKENMEKIENREEVGSGSGANTGEHQSEGGVNGGAVSAAIIVTVGGLLAISVGIVATIWLFYRARQRETGEKQL